MTEFCGIPLASLRENSITELNLRGGGVGVPGAIVLSKLLPSAAALTSLKCAPAAPKRSLLCQRPLTAHSSFPWQLGQEPALRHRWVGQRLLHCRGHHQAVRGAQGERRDLAQVRRHPACLLFCQCPLTSLLSLAYPWQLDPQQYLRHQTLGRRHLHCREHHQALRGAQGEHRDLAQVRRRPACLPFCQRPLTRLLSHHLRSAPCSQSQAQQDRRQGRFHARRCPQGDADHPPRVRRRPMQSVCVCVSGR